MQNQTSIETQEEEKEIIPPRSLWEMYRWIFEDSPQPKNIWEIYRWLFFEPELLLFPIYIYDKKGEIKDYEFFWKSILINSAIATLTYLLISLIPAFFYSADMLNKDSNIITYWAKDTLQNWDDYPFLKKYLAWLRYTMFGLVGSLAFGLAFGWAGRLARGLAFGLGFGLAGGLAFGLGLGLAESLERGLVFSVAGSLAFGLGFGYMLGLDVGLERGLMIGLMMGLMGVVMGVIGGAQRDFEKGLEGVMLWGISCIISFYCWYFRMPFLFFYYLIQFLKEYDLKNNPYYLNSFVWTPILFLDKKLVEESHEKPQEGEDFSIFLFRRRKFQRTLALKIQHASIAGFWKQNRLKPIILEKEPVVLDDKEGKKYTPSQAWFALLEELKATLADFYKENSTSQKLAYIKKTQEILSNFIRQTQAESPLWKKYYLLTLPLWEKSAKEEHDRLQIQLDNEQPFGENIYKDNVKLTPENQSVFFGRKALQAELKQKVQESTTLPLFLIQGQRRTGKSSLISFLSEYLGETGFAIVSYDMQGQLPQSVTDWLSALLKETQRVVKESTELPILPISWVLAWQVVSERLLALAQARQKRIILAIDEYELLHDRLFQQDTAQAADLLGAMRGFSQQQNQVVFLFAGAAYFTELKNPNWNEYFVQANLLKVDYLNESDTNKLIDAYPALTYASEVRQKMYALTNGHPALLQKILYEIVTQANILQVRAIDEEMLDKALERKVLIQQNGVIDIFWGEFCKNRNLRGTVFQILEGKTEGYDKKAIFQLEEHGFILRKEDKFVFRVPLFEQWLRKFAEVVD